MKRAQLAAVMLLMTVVSAKAWAQGAAWKEIKPAGCLCSVKMPGEPKESKQTFTTEVGPVDAFMYILEADGGETAFLLGRNDYPADKVKGADKQKMLEGAKQGAVTNVKGKLVGEKKIEVNGYPGIEIEVEAGANKVFARIVIAKNRLYQVLVVMKTNKVRPLDVQQFLKSLVITMK